MAGAAITMELYHGYRHTSTLWVKKTGPFSIWA